MSDNTTVTPGSGATVGADLIGGVLYQRIKLVHGADGTNAGDVSTGNGFPVQIVGGALSLSGEDHMGLVGVDRALGQLVPTVSTTPAYSIGDVVGGKLAFASAMRIAAGSGALTSVSFTNTSAVTPDLVLLLYNADLQSTLTDNAAPTWNAADDAHILGQVRVAAADWDTVAGRSFATIATGQLALNVATGQTLYGILVAKASFAFATTTALRIRPGIARD